MRSPHSGLLVLGKAETGRRTAFCGLGHGCTPTGAAAAAGAVLLAVRPPFGQQLLLRVAVGQSSDARVRLPFRCAFFCLNAADRHTVALHQPSIPLVFRGDTGLGAGTQLVSHSALRLTTSFWVVVLAFVAISALLSWGKKTGSCHFTT